MGAAAQAELQLEQWELPGTELMAAPQYQVVERVVIVPVRRGLREPQVVVRQMLQVQEPLVQQVLQQVDLPTLEEPEQWVPVVLKSQQQAEDLVLAE